MSNQRDMAIQKALEHLENLLDIVKPKVESRLSSLDLYEITQDEITLALIRTLIDEVDQETSEEDLLSTFTLLNQRLLSEYGIEISIEDSESSALENYEKIKNEIKKNEQEKKLRITQLEEKIAKLETDFLKSFIERVGNAHFASLAIIPKAPFILNAIRLNDIDNIKMTISNKIIEIEQSFPEVDSPDSQFKDMLESMLTIFSDYPKLLAIFEKNDISLNYEELTDLLLNKHKKLRAINLGPQKEALFRSLREATFIHLKQSKSNEPESYVITKDDVVTSFVACLSAMKTQDTIPTLREYETDFNEVFSYTLNRLFIELDITTEDLPEEEIIDLIKRKEEQKEIENFENELKMGKSSSANQFSSRKINDLSGIEFEDLLQDLFKKLGHLVVKTPVSGDQGADLIIKKGGEKIAVQAKRYSKPVTNKAIQEAVAATKHYKCDRAMVITTSKFTKSARQLASSNNVELWDGNKLNKVLKDIITH